MARAGALALAVGVVLAIFGLALVAVHWFLGTAALWQAIYSRWFVIALIIFNSAIFSLVFVGMEIRRRWRGKSADAEETGLLSASQRFSRDTDRDRPKL